MSGSGKGKPELMTISDISDMSEVGAQLQSADAESLVQDDQIIASQINIDRRYFDFVSESKVKDFVRLDNLAEVSDPRNDSTTKQRVMVAVSISLLDDSPEKKIAFDKWYNEEHIPMLSVVPGWLRTRRYVTSTVGSEVGSETEYLALHEYTAVNGLDGPEFVAATTTPWNSVIKRDVVKEKRRRVYEHVYSFGPAPRDINSTFMSHKSKTNGFSNGHGATTRSSYEAIESFITTRDGVVLPYRLQGARDSNAPLIILSNSVLVNYHIWDAFIERILRDPVNKNFRILRYDTRGRTSDCGKHKITIDVLAADIVDLLDALHVSKAAAVIGVSLGGITALNTALKYSGRVEAFISCDTSARSPAGNSKTWGDRIEVAAKEGAMSTIGGGKDEARVGEQLAEMTAKRWFVQQSWESPEIAAVCKDVQAMVASNSLSGFRSLVEALYDYDISAEMAKGRPRGLFVVGSEDGVLPGVMKKMAEAYGGGKGEYSVIQQAGHLPMVEHPEEFADIVSKFLGKPSGLPEKINGA